MLQKIGIIIIIVFIYISCSVHKAGKDDLTFEGRLPHLTKDNILQQEGWYVWGGSVVKGEDNKYYMFYARWSADCIDCEEGDKGRFKNMSGWLKYSEIACAVADNPNGPFNYVSTVVKGTGKKDVWNQYNAHNPHIKKFNDNYYLYYIATTETPDSSYWKGLIGGQCIGVIKSKSIQDLISGKFKHPEKPIVAPDNISTFHRAVNPSVTQGHDGKFYMMFKSYSTRSGRKGHMTHWIAKSDAPDGPFFLAGNVFEDAKYAAEDPYFWYDKNRNRYYAIIKNWSKDNVLAPQFGALALITSENGINGWEPATNRLVSLKEYITSKGKKVELNNIERPQLLFNEEGELICLYTAAKYKNNKNDGPYQGTQPSVNLQFLLNN
ncbi:MAG: glycoside hydrolase family protein [Carboxylicivirga sp.]|jgi:IS1 family transposase|nr:glycoside hydrolase family protein [Carboxylicivirga sp.]MCT4648648.1 glycoside hydrolase family protein [Carboxylicivirga sp.]